MVVAPLRAKRPGAGSPSEPAPEPDCPFCEGREHATPPETFAFGPPGRAPDTPGWSVRVVPNKFPALAGADGRQEVVVHTPRHVLSMSELTPEDIAAVAGAWQARARAAAGEGFRYVQALLNEGREAGASLPHGHSQLVWLPGEPPAVERERRAGGEGCALCGLLDSELRDGRRVVLEADGLVLLAAYAGRVPYELLVAPRACEADAYASDRLAGALRLLAEAVRRLQAVEGRVPLNAWLHTASLGGSGAHWHIEVLPRLTVLAGLELGAELYVNPLAPETAAKRLRSAPAV